MSKQSPIYKSIQHLVADVGYQFQDPGVRLGEYLSFFKSFISKLFLGSHGLSKSKWDVSWWQNEGAIWWLSASRETSRGEKVSQLRDIDLTRNLFLFRWYKNTNPIGDANADCPQVTNSKVNQ